MDTPGAPRRTRLRGLGLARDFRTGRGKWAHSSPDDRCRSWTVGSPRVANARVGEEAISRGSPGLDDRAQSWRGGNRGCPYRCGRLRVGGGARWDSGSRSIHLLDDVRLGRSWCRCVLRASRHSWIDRAGTADGNQEWSCRVGVLSLRMLGARPDDVLATSRLQLHADPAEHRRSCQGVDCLDIDECVHVGVGPSMRHAYATGRDVIADGGRQGD